MQTDVAAALRTLLGGNHHYTVGTTRTVDSGGRGVFQNFHRLDVGGVDVVHVAIGEGETINNIERVGACAD